MTDVSERPIARLKPKKSPKRFRHGDPWVFADELVLDRRTKAITAGAVVTLQDNAREPFAVATFNSGSKIAARILDVDPSQVIDKEWFVGKLAIAQSMREHMFSDPFYRLVHAEGDGLPGLIIDRFGDVFVVQPNTAWAETHLDVIVSALKEISRPVSIIKNAAGRARQLEGLDDQSDTLFGTPPDRVPVPMNGAIYMADIIGGQKTGLFFDQRENHAFAARLAKGGTVLDVFSHVGGFGLAALAGGASTALCVDGSAAALALAQAGAEASGVSERFAVQQGDAVKTMQEMHAEGQFFDTVICDPPAFAPRREAVTAGLRGYERVAINAAKLVAPGGYLVLCSCSGAIPLSDFARTCVNGIGRAGRSGQVLHTGGAACDHPMHPKLDETAYLKALFFRLN